MYQKTSGSEKFYASERGGGYQVSSSKTCHTVPKKFVREHFGVSEKPCIENFMYTKGISLNSVEKSLSHRADKIRTRTLVFRKNSGIEKFQAKEGKSFTVLSKIFLSHSAQKFRKGFLLVLRKFLVSKSFMDEKGGITIFRLKIFVSQCRKTSYRNPLVFDYFRVSKAVNDKS